NSSAVTDLERQDVRCLRPLGALGDLEGDVLSFAQFTIALGGDRGVVGEDVGAAAVLLDESEALLRVEPLHSASCHAFLLLHGVSAPDQRLLEPRRARAHIRATLHVYAGGWRCAAENSLRETAVAGRDARPGEARREL